MTKDEARKELLETLEEYCHNKGYNLQVFAGLSDLVYTLYPLQKAMTNGDWVRSLDDDALARWLDIFDMDICENCPLGDNAYCEEELCGEQWLEWVKQEHGND
jgi:hypothetical protein